VGTGVLTNLTWAATTRVFKAVTERIARSGPNVVAFVGTAAGMKPSDHCHLDVVVASRIHNPYAGKQVPSESGSKLLGRDKTYAVPVPLLAVVNACIAESE
jgi:diadenosine tetraphosphate (Ap4A) HIT family hydrolase